MNSGNHLQPLVELPSASTPPARRLHHQGARETRDVARRRGGADGAIEFLGERKQLIQKRKSSENLRLFVCPKSWRITQSWPTAGQFWGWIDHKSVGWTDLSIWWTPWINSHLVDDLSLFPEIAGTCDLVGNLWQVDSPSLTTTFTNKPYGMVNCDKTLISSSWFWLETFPLQIAQSSFTAFGPKCIKQSATPCSARQKGRRCKASLSSSRTWKRSRNQRFLNPGSEKVSSFTWPRLQFDLKTYLTMVGDLQPGGI